MRHTYLGGVHKLHRQEEVGSPKMYTFVNVYTVEIVNVGGQKRPETCQHNLWMPPYLNAWMHLSSSLLESSQLISHLINLLLCLAKMEFASNCYTLKIYTVHGEWRSRYHCYKHSATQDWPNMADFPSLLASSVFYS